MGISSRCTISKELFPGIARKRPRTPLSDLQGVNTINEKSQRDTYGVGWNSRMGVRPSRLSSHSSFLDKDGIFVNSTNSKLLERAHGILITVLFPQHLLEVKSLKHLTNVTLHDRITKSLLHLHKKKKPPSISAQFQASLTKLMETLGQAEPYFVKCIRSNADKEDRFRWHLKSHFNRLVRTERSTLIHMYRQYKDLRLQLVC
ncbi:UNVERIFIED_CONTAM: Unconventional myosin-IXa [Gekko kuhli]